MTPTEQKEQNFKLTLCYDGSRYYGWEHQKTTENTIQGKIENVLLRMLAAEGVAAPSVHVIGAGRTDAGVHARAMTANVRLTTRRTPEELRYYLNQYLPEDIAVNEVKIAAQRFHARYSATGKTYCYSCYIGIAKPVFDRKYLTVLDIAPDISRMRVAAQHLTGTHDFKSFCGNPKMKKSTVRTVDSIELRQSGSILRIYFHGDGFLQHMVRIMSGTLLEVGFGKIAPEAIPGILEAKDRAFAGCTAPPQGLCLMQVDY